MAPLVRWLKEGNDQTYCVCPDVTVSGFKPCLPLFSAVVNCSDPGLVENGVRQSGLRYPEVFSYGVTVAIHCKRGFYLLGSALLTCQHDGRWDRPIPHCLGRHWHFFNSVTVKKMSPFRILQQNVHKTLSRRAQRVIGGYLFFSYLSGEAIWGVE